MRRQKDEDEARIDHNQARHWSLAHDRLEAEKEAQARLSSIDPATLASLLAAALGYPSLGLSVAESLQALKVPGASVSAVASICNAGYSGPYCAGTHLHLKS